MRRQDFHLNVQHCVWSAQQRRNNATTEDEAAELLQAILTPRNREASANLIVDDLFSLDKIFFATLQQFILKANRDQDQHLLSTLNLLYKNPNQLCVRGRIFDSQALIAPPGRGL